MSDIAVSWPAQPNEHGRPMLWFGSWLVGSEGAEAGWFYSGRGGQRNTYPVPAGATGLRIRRWPNEGLEPEYADLLELAQAADLHPVQLDFDARQRFSLLADHIR